VSAASLLLDTHIFVWWRLDPGRLSKAQQVALTHAERTETGFAISAITLREIAAMAARKRLEIDQPLDRFLEEIESHPLLEVLPITAKIAASSVALGADFPPDPADQIIAATALCHNLKLVTADERIRRSRLVPVI
jgi:PIN domain nuclease of toxin-antitoxin system